MGDLLQPGCFTGLRPVLWRPIRSLHALPFVFLASQRLHSHLPFVAPEGRLLLTLSSPFTNRISSVSFPSQKQHFSSDVLTPPLSTFYPPTDPFILYSRSHHQHSRKLCSGTWQCAKMPPEKPRERLTPHKLSPERSVPRKRLLLSYSSHLGHSEGHVQKQQKKALWSATEK